MAWLLIVIPFSLSRSISSRTWSIISRSLMVLVVCNSLSARVLLPWSIWAIMQKLRIFFIKSIVSFKIPAKVTDFSGIMERNRVNSGYGFQDIGHLEKSTGECMPQKDAL